MVKLSLWARQHPGKARLLIVFLHIVLNILAVFVGFNLWQLGWVIPASVVYLTIIFFFSACFFYKPAPQIRRRLAKRHLYCIQKSCDFILCLCSFILVCFTANNYLHTGAVATGFAANASLHTKDGRKPTAEEILASLTYRDKSSLTRLEKRILKREFNQQLKVYVKAKITNDDEAGEKALFIILSIIGAMGLTILLTALVCGIACNGSEALAVIAGIVGLAAIIWLLLVVINKIKNHHKQSVPVEMNNTNK